MADDDDSCACDDECSFVRSEIRRVRGSGKGKEDVAGQNEPCASRCENAEVPRDNVALDIEIIKCASLGRVPTTHRATAWSVLLFLVARCEGVAQVLMWSTKLKISWQSEAESGMPRKRIVQKARCGWLFCPVHCGWHHISLNVNSIIRLDLQYD